MGWLLGFAGLCVGVVYSEGRVWLGVIVVLGVIGLAILAPVVMEKELGIGRKPEKW